MKPEKPSLYINGQQQAIDPYTAPLVSPPSHEMTLKSFLIKDAILLFIVQVLFGVAFQIIFIGLIIISPVLILLALLLWIEVYHDIVRQLGPGKRFFATVLAICSLLTIVGSIAVLAIIASRSKNSTTS
jgi:hypothetical protein